MICLDDVIVLNQDQEGLRRDLRREHSVRVRKPWIPSKLGNNGTGTKSVLGIPLKFGRKENIPCRAILRKESVTVRELAGKVSVKINFLDSGSPASSVTLSASPDCKRESSDEKSELSDKTPIRDRMLTGFTLVDPKSRSNEWEIPFEPKTGASYNDRCVGRMRGLGRTSGR